MATVVPVWAHTSRFQKLVTASRLHFTRTVAYASRHREITAINATDGEDVPLPLLYSCAPDHMSLSNRQEAAIERGGYSIARSDGSSAVIVYHVGKAAG